MDGTKIEAQANRCTFAWGKATRKHKAKLATKVRALLQEIERVNEAENARYWIGTWKKWTKGPCRAAPSSWSARCRRWKNV